MDYIELTLKFDFRQDIADLLMAELIGLGYEGFQDTGSGLIAYIRAGHFSLGELEAWIMSKPAHPDLTYTYQYLEDRNWNSKWESHFEPVVFPGRCIVRAPYHAARKDVEADIVIEPNMSFGTAHHSTTAMMINLLFELRPLPPRVLDMGCGTGILAILASKLGAMDVTAIDNDKWAFENTIKNCVKNKCEKISVYLGDASWLAGKHFDLILANIDRNTLIRDLPVYSGCLNKPGRLVISGFLTDDVNLIRSTAETLGLVFERDLEEGEWSAAYLLYAAARCRKMLYIAVCWLIRNPVRK